MNSRSLKISFFYCSNSLNNEQLTHCREVIEENINNGELKIINLPCSGKVNLPYLVKAFETGADGVLLVTCEEGHCQNIEGNMRALKRAEAVDSLLEEIGLGKGRIAVLRAEEGPVEQIAGKIKDFCQGIYNIKEQFVTARGQ
jgi:coenzyme F420-reducing hydrogenase delta subunit